MAENHSIKIYKSGIDDNSITVEYLISPPQTRVTGRENLVMQLFNLNGTDIIGLHILGFIAGNYEYTQIFDGAGSGFADVASCMAYLQELNPEGAGGGVVVDTNWFLNNLALSNQNRTHTMTDAGFVWQSNYTGTGQSTIDYGYGAFSLAQSATVTGRTNQIVVSPSTSQTFDFKTGVNFLLLTNQSSDTSYIGIHPEGIFVKTDTTSPTKNTIVPTGFGVLNVDGLGASYSNINYGSFVPRKRGILDAIEETTAKIFVNSISIVTLANTTTETTIFNGGTTDYTSFGLRPLNNRSFILNSNRHRKFIIKASGFMAQTTGGGSITIRLYWGTTVLGIVTSTIASNPNQYSFELEAWIEIFSTGVSGQMRAGGKFVYGLTSGGAHTQLNIANGTTSGTNTSTPTIVDTTSLKAINLTLQRSGTAGAGNLITITSATITQE